MQTEGNRCIFQEAVNGPLRDPYEVHGVVRQYLEATKLVAYNAVGINWALEAALVEPVDWYRKHFGGSGSFSEYAPCLAPSAEEYRYTGVQLELQVSAAFTSA